MISKPEVVGSENPLFRDEELWVDPDRLVIPARSDDEVRYALLAKYRKRIWAAFYTIRGGNTRIISVRRARKAEEALYES